MSLPSNPLSKFRSSSYHHLLVLCDSTTTAEEIAGDDAKFQEMFAANGTRLHKDSVSGDTVIKEQKSPKGGKYILLINSATDADLVLSEINWSTIIGSHAGNNGAANTTSMATDGTMKIGEPQAARFLNILNKSYDALRRDPSGCCFLLKTIFVGHTDKDTTDYIFKVKPIMFVLFDLVALFDTTGTSYTLSFVGISNGASRTPQALTCVDKVTLAPKTQELKTCFKELEDEIERSYDYHICKLRNVNNLPEGIGKEVKYIIELDSHYYKPEYVMNKQLDKIKTTGTKKDPAIITFGERPTIEGAIHKIMRMSAKVVEEGSAPDKGKEKEVFLYKIVSTLLSGADARNHPRSGGAEYLYIYRIKRYKQQLNSVSGQLLASNPPPGNVIEFDYYFTGKNVDIMQFDLKMEQGMMFLYTSASTNSLPQTTSDHVNSSLRKDESTNQNSGHIQTDKSFGGIRPDSPLLFSSTVRDPSNRQVKDSAKTSSFNAQLSKHAALESMEGKIKIIGNPVLLNNLTRTPTDIATDKKPETHPIEGQTADVALDFETIPAFVKVNVKMPSNDNDPGFSEDFWYTGFYYMFSVLHTFSSGSFTQEIDMFALPIESQKDSDANAGTVSKTPTKPVGLAKCETEFNKIDASTTPPKKPPVNTGIAIEEMKAGDV